MSSATNFGDIMCIIHFIEEVVCSCLNIVVHVVIEISINKQNNNL